VRWLVFINLQVVCFCCLRVQPRRAASGLGNVSAPLSMMEGKSIWYHRTWYNIFDEQQCCHRTLNCGSGQWVWIYDFFGNFFIWHQVYLSYARLSAEVDHPTLFPVALSMSLWFPVLLI